jgi:cytochrome c biogenesis protein CcmG/thiol:disulfide interchange protein DsbE
MIGRPGLALLAAVALGCALACLPAAAGPAVGQPAPPLVVTTLDGATFDLSAERGHVVVVNFWATWCPPCRGEMPLLDTFARRHRADGLVLVGLSVDRRRDRHEVESVMQAFEYRAGIADGAKVNGFGPPQALPMTYVIDATGTIRAVLAPGRGPLTDEVLEGAVAPLLGPPTHAE